ncbi:Zinc finger HIT domain-containing protein 3, variant 4 [Schistosoma haematobium]|uniref:Zinc finger HIT domain-containing protein 3, variant 4 n=1 Tax=Schistosoma haematobium TaxID=6185 RepID=A0A922ITT4_SCHHA|nr:Zinc finger HIT domain-containing protein 3, variant 4 [Schistosoma haematobium]KAH9587213.1 Zinc finger HIT domain-containing protein 3, variant 4 [Schistosoma haematobium]
MTFYFSLIIQLIKFIIRSLVYSLSMHLGVFSFFFSLSISLSHQVETYDLKSLNVITSYDNNDNSDHLNWNEVNKILGQSKINMFFSNTQLSTLVSLLHESYIIEAKYLLEKISGTAQKLSVAEDLGRLYWPYKANTS